MIRLSGYSSMKISNNPKRQQKGQSLAEFLVVAVFVLVPTLIGLIYLAKTGELRHRSYETARYSARGKLLGRMMVIPMQKTIRGWRGRLATVSWVRQKE